MPEGCNDLLVWFVQGARFPVINAVKASEEAGEPRLQTFAFRLKAASQLLTFMQAIEENKALQNQAAAVSHLAPPSGEVLLACHLLTASEVAMHVLWHASTCL